MAEPRSLFEEDSPIDTLSGGGKQRSLIHASLKASEMPIEKSKRLIYATLRASGFSKDDSKKIADIRVVSDSAEDVKNFVASIRGELCKASLFSSIASDQVQQGILAGIMLSAPENPAEQALRIKAIETYQRFFGQEMEIKKSKAKTDAAERPVMQALGVILSREGTGVEIQEDEDVEQTDDMTEAMAAFERELDSIEVKALWQQKELDGGNSGVVEGERSNFTTNGDPNA